MAKQIEQVEVSKEARELGKALVGLVKASKKALKDGFQPTDVAMVVSSEFQSLLVGIQGVEQIPAEEKEDLLAFSNALGLSTAGLTAALLEKEPVSPQA